MHWLFNYVLRPPAQAVRGDEREGLTAQLKALGFEKLGKRKKVEQVP